MKCNYCGFENKKEFLFCVNCGSELPKYNIEKNQNNCSNCGSPNLPGNKFCVSCGNKLIKPAQKRAGRNNKRVETQKVKKRKSERNRKRIKNRKSVIHGLSRIELLWIGFAVILVSVILVLSFDSIFRPSIKNNEGVSA